MESEISGGKQPHATQMQTLNWQRANELIDSNTRVVVSERLTAQPLVSVCLQTFNHRAFIKEAVDSILAQKTTFPFELIIGDDQSNDGTAEILREYQQRHDDKIKLIESTNNLGHITGNGRLNLVRNIQQARGKYIAFLEGDDFWTSETKLQQQADVLESNPSLDSVTHDSDVLFDDTGERQQWRDPGELAEFELSDIVAVKCPFHTSSFFCRAKVLHDLPEFFLRIQSADMAMFMFAGIIGPVRRIPEVMSVYRKNEGGVTYHPNHMGFQFHINRIVLHQHMMRYAGREQKRFRAVITKHARRAIGISLKRNWFSLPGSLCRVFGAIGPMGIFRLLDGGAA